MGTYNGIEVVKFADGALYLCDVRGTERHWINTTPVTAIENEILERLGWRYDEETDSLIKTYSDGKHLTVNYNRGSTANIDISSGSVKRYFASYENGEPSAGETWILYSSLGTEMEATVIEHRERLWFLFDDTQGTPQLERVDSYPSSARRKKD